MYLIPPIPGPLAFTLAGPTPAGPTGRVTITIHKTVSYIFIISQIFCLFGDLRSNLVRNLTPTVTEHVRRSE
jgi:hypothetical protein